MPLNRPVLDDRSYEQIRDELVRRIPVYAPEWTDHNVSDPGIALLELFSYLTENVLFRFNQIPEATKLEFLRLLQIPMLPAAPSQSLVTFSTKLLDGQRIEQGSVVTAGAVEFSTREEVRVLPLSAMGVAKISDESPDASSEEGEFYRQAYLALDVEPDLTAAYHTETIWLDEPGVPVDLDKSVDDMMWVAVLAEKASVRDSVRQQIRDHADAPLLFNVGFVPEVNIEPVVDTTTAEFADRFRCPGDNASSEGESVIWQASTPTSVSAGVNPRYHPLQIAGDTTAGLTRSGIVRLQFPADFDQLGLFDVDDPNLMGTGDLPPVLDDDLNDRLLFWLRAFRPDGRKFGQILYVGANCSTVQQTSSARAESLGVGTGQPNQAWQLNHQQIIPGSVQLEVEEAQGWVPWAEVEHFFASTESDRHFVVDHEAALIKVGNGLQGLVPQIGQRIRVRGYLYGGGKSGNVAAGAINKLSPNKPVMVENPLAAWGGDDAELIESALQRIPGELRRRNRAVTRDDFKELALLTPGAVLGRAECLPLYHPQLPDEDSAGVVSVIIWPQQDTRNPNAPLPTVNQIRAVCAYLDTRRLVTTELYVMPPKYRSVAVAVGVKVKDGFGIDAVRHWVELVLRQYLAPLPPYGPNGDGWPLGRRIQQAELIAAAHHVEGVEYLEDLQLVGWDDAGNRLEGIVELARNEVPELIGITVESGPVTVDPGELIEPPPGDTTPIPIPVIRETC